MDVPDEKYQPEVSESSRTSEDEFLLESDCIPNIRQKPLFRKSPIIHLGILYFTNLMTLLLFVFLLLHRNHIPTTADPSLEGVYCQSLF